MIEFLRTRPSIPRDAVRGDMTEHTTGATTVYLEHSGGYRVVREAMDRADIEYEVYALDRKRCIDLALLVREELLENLPGMILGGAEVLDIGEISAPVYIPDVTSREHVYGGEVSVFYTPYP
ncbi:hypothetical protein [Streptomyces buecherae]|uniref:hypothetical protein n=1 Tax=Streptomyces buecherae TaxID=2763006 RepID=UPI00164E6018|nr:hypothetical protein [Streptomyces buecherae]QNJ42023.1 hypothetical protein H7H31_21340 [Streptomyces buecherae]